jgi:hypothetical protein
MPDRPLYYSVNEVAGILKIRRHGVYGLMNQPDGIRAVDVSLKPGIKPLWRISAEDLEGFIRRRTHHAAAPRPRRKRPAKKWF